MAYILYILKCADSTLYTGCTTDITRRLSEHSAGRRGAKYTRARRPVKLVWSQVFGTLAAVRKREAEIKRLTRKQKLQLLSFFAFPLSQGKVVLWKDKVGSVWTAYQAQRR